MSRRYSDAPINLIARIPTPEQLSAARNKKRSFSEAVREAGAACLSRVAEMGMWLRRFGRTVTSFVTRMRPSRLALGRPNENRKTGETEAVANQTPVSSDRLLEWIEQMHAVLPPVEPASASHPAMTVTDPEPVRTVIASVSPEEVEALRTELIAQRQEMARVLAQLQELKSLVGSQQQVLMYLGQEMESQQLPIRAVAALAPPPPKKPRASRAKSSATAASDSRTVSQRLALDQ